MYLPTKPGMLYLGVVLDLHDSFNSYLTRVQARVEAVYQVSTEPGQAQ